MHQHPVSARGQMLWGMRLGRRRATGRPRTSGPTTNPTTAPTTPVIQAMRQTQVFGHRRSSLGGWESGANFMGLGQACPTPGQCASGVRGHGLSSVLRRSSRAATLLAMDVLDALEALAAVVRRIVDSPVSSAASRESLDEALRRIDELDVEACTWRGQGCILEKLDELREHAKVVAGAAHDRRALAGDTLLVVPPRARRAPQSPLLRPGTSRPQRARGLIALAPQESGHLASFPRGRLDCGDLSTILHTGTSSPC